MDNLRLLSPSNRSGASIDFKGPFSARQESVISSPTMKGSPNGQVTVKCFSARKAPNSPQTAPAISLRCQRHQDNVVEKICTYPGCKAEIALCADCISESQAHITSHKDGIVGYKEFIEYCQLNSIKSRMDVLTKELSFKEFQELVLDLDNQTAIYKAHLKKEEEKIDQDFDILLQQFTKDMNEIKAGIKKNLAEEFDNFNQDAVRLKEFAKGLSQEKVSNQNFSNSFDDFLTNLQMISRANGRSNGHPINLKKLLTDVFRIISNGGVKGNGATNINTSNNSSFSQALNASLNSSVINQSVLWGNSKRKIDKMHKTISQTLNDVKENIKNKPLYKNKGEANKVFRNALSDSRKIYYHFLPILKDFISTQRTQTPFTNETVFSEIPNISTSNLAEFSMQQSAIYSSPNANKILIDKNQSLSRVDHLSTLRTTHKKGILALALLGPKLLATGSDDRTVQVFKFSQNEFEPVAEVACGADVTCLGICRTSLGIGHLLVGGYQSYLVLDENYEIIKRVDLEHEGSINALVGLKDGSSVISCSTDSKLIVSNFCEFFPLKKAFDHRDSLYCLELSDNNELLATAGKDKTIKVWRVIFHENDYKNGCFDSLKLDLSIEGAHSTDITALKISLKNNNILLSASATGEIKMWDIAEGALLKSYKDHSGLVYKINIIDKLNADGQKNLFTKKKIVTTNSKKTACRKINSGAKPVSPIVPVDEFLFITAAFDGSYKLWETEKQQPVCELKGRNRMDCFPYGGCILYKAEQSDNQLLMLTSGNKLDSDLNLWVVK